MKTWKRFVKNLQLDLNFEKYYREGFYTGSIGNLTQSREPEILLLTYDQKLMAFSPDAKKTLDIPFSNDVCRLYIEDLYLSGEKVFVSLAYSGEVRAFSDTGEIYWKFHKEEIIDGFLCNLDYDKQKEIVVLHKPNQIRVLNNQGKTVAKYTHSEKILHISHAKINSSDKQIIVFSDKKNQLYALDIEKTINQIPVKIESIRGLDSITIYNRNILILLDEKNHLNLLDKKGNLIERFSFEKKIETFFTGYLFDDKIESLCILTRDSHLLVYQIKIADTAEFLKAETAQQEDAASIAASKGADSSEQKPDPTLEFDPNYFHSRKPITPEISLEDRLQKQTKEKQSSENLELRCPECGDFFTPTIIKRILEGKTAFCEECGLEIHKSDFSNLP